MDIAMVLSVLATAFARWRIHTIGRARIYRRSSGGPASRPSRGRRTTPPGPTPSGGSRMLRSSPPANPFRPGEDNPRWRGGQYDNGKGYLRVSAGPTRRQPYAHRHRIEQLMLEQAIIARVDAVLTGEIGPPPWEPDATFGQMIVREVLDVVSHPPTLPPHLHVHHVDGDRQHNCPCNLQVLDAAIHRHLTADHRRFLRRHQEQEIRAKLRGERPQ